MYDVIALGELLIDFAPYGTSEQGNALFEVSRSRSPNISWPTLPMKAVLCPSFCSMASMLQGAPPGQTSKSALPCSLVP